MTVARVLVACEQSQAVTKALRKKGIAAFSADTLPCSGGHPEWHLQGDVRDLLDQPWSGCIAFPPCTHLASSGAHLFREKQRDGRQQAAVDFFLAFVALMAPDSDCKVAIENPVGIMSTLWRKPDQIVHPWMFGHSASKRTCLWLHRLPPLTPTAIVPPNGWKWIPSPKHAGLGTEVVSRSGFTFESLSDADPPRPVWDNQTPSGQSKHSQKFYRGILRSKTYAGFAEAIAAQWAPLF